VKNYEIYLGMMKDNDFTRKLEMKVKKLKEEIGD